VAVALAAFGALVDGVTEGGDLASYDPAITSSMVAARTPGLTFAAELVTAVGSEVAVGLLTGLTMLWLWFRRREPARAVLLGASMGAAAVLTIGIKHVLTRHRPPSRLVVGPVDTGFSFPSGHTVFSTVFAGMVVLLLVWPNASRLRRSVAVAAAVVASLTVGATRVYLGYHWTTDVIAGWVLGVAVVAVAGAVSASVSRAGARWSRAARVRPVDDEGGASDASPAG
jgi:undecaprenyl-diphosphatase